MSVLTVGCSAWQFVFRGGSSPDMACLDVHLRVPHSFSSQIVALQLSGKVDKEAYAKVSTLSPIGTESLILFDVATVDLVPAVLD